MYLSPFLMLLPKKLLGGSCINNWVSGRMKKLPRA
jgi:hypothetical protein